MKSTHTFRSTLRCFLQGRERVKCRVIKRDVGVRYETSSDETHVAVSLQPLPREWCNVFFFSPLCLTAARFFTPDPVVNSSERDRWWTDAHPFDASHPSIALCSSPTSKSCHSSQLHAAQAAAKKGSLSTCQLIEWSGRSLTWLPLLHCSAIQAACPCFRFKWATWIPPPHTHAHFCFLSTRSHLHAFLR